MFYALAHSSWMVFTLKWLFTVLPKKIENLEKKMHEFAKVLSQIREKSKSMDAMLTACITLGCWQALIHKWIAKNRCSKR